MAKLYFRYGAMGASKSANAIMTAHNYEEQGRLVILGKPSIDIRWNANMITSRAGNLQRNCELINNDGKFIDIVEKYEKANKKSVEAIIVDECQFLTKEQVIELAHLVDNKDIVVICYGLKNSAINGQFFEGSGALLYYADSIEELKTLCSFCRKKAIMNLRLRNNFPIYFGDVISIGDVKSNDNKDAEVYLPVCRHHYFHPKL